MSTRSRLASPKLHNSQLDVNPMILRVSEPLREGKYANSSAEHVAHKIKTYFHHWTEVCPMVKQGDGIVDGNVVSAIKSAD
jgi:hypothetical protein